MLQAQTLWLKTELPVDYRLWFVVPYSLDWLKAQHLPRSTVEAKIRFHDSPRVWWSRQSWRAAGARQSVPRPCWSAMSVQIQFLVKINVRNGFKIVRKFWNFSIITISLTSQSVHCLEKVVPHSSRVETSPPSSIPTSANHAPTGKAIAIDLIKFLSFSFLLAKSRQNSALTWQGISFRAHSHDSG